MNRILMKQNISIALLLLAAFFVLMPPAGAQVFRDHGPHDGIPDSALGLAAPLAVQGPLTLSRSPDIEYLIQQLDQTLVTGFLQDLVAFGPRVTETLECNNAGQYIFDEFTDMGLDVRFHHWSLGGYSDRNVEATLHDVSGTSNDIYIVCSHYDSVPGSPGADDNGSGTAAVLALAEIFRHCSFDADIRFVTFSGEEQGLLGSWVYAQEARNNGDNIVAVLNADMIGYATDPGNRSQIKLYYDNASAWIRNSVTNTAQLYNNVLGLDIVGYTGGGGSDHASFWAQNYHAVFFHEYKFNDYYHSSQDIIANMDLDYYTRCSKLFLASLAEIAGPPVLNPVVDIKVNGQDGPLNIPSTQAVPITISLDSLSQSGVRHDWWIYAERNGSGLFSWTYLNGWKSSSTPVRAYNGPLVDLNDFSISTGRIPAGTWELVFAVDELNNTYEGTYADRVDVTSY
jgi:hypothetical protein